MFSVKEMPSPSSLFTAYASTMASVMLFRSMVTSLVPPSVRDLLLSALGRLFRARAAERLTLVIDEIAGMTRNELYDAAAAYLSTKISPNTKRLEVTKAPKDKNLIIRLAKDEQIVDSHQGLELHWTLVCTEPGKGGPGDPHLPRGAPMNAEKKHFELSFEKTHREAVVGSYLPFVLEQAKAKWREERVLKMHTLSNAMPYGLGGGGGTKWDSVALEHPATFDTLAMDKALKAAVVGDLDLFRRRQDFYRRVGKAWKRGYLLYGPPGTGKSSLVAAIANYLKFDVYDLQLANVFTDSELRRLLLATANRSILVIEDIDCSVDLPDSRGGGLKKSDNQQKKNRSGSRTSLTLSGLLNFIDGLWSSCGDERIIIFTTNHKDRLDPALIRPGRMDMHIHMSYCTYHGFKLLAANYLGVRAGHKLFGEIELLIDEAKVTPAQVAEELMRSEDVNVALKGLVKLLKRKIMEGDEKGEGEDEDEDEGEGEDENKDEGEDEDEDEDEFEEETDDGAD